MPDMTRLDGTTMPAVFLVTPGGHALAAVLTDKDGNPTAVQNSGTREHSVADITRTAVGSTSVAIALPTLGTSREIYVMANTRCFFRTGTSTITAAPAAAHPLAQDERFYLRVPVGHTHIAVIQDSAAGFLSVCAVA